MRTRRIVLAVAALFILICPACRQKKAETQAPPPQAAKKTEQKTEYLAVLAEGRKIGHAVMDRKAEDEKVVTTMQMELTISRMGTVLQLRTMESNVETADGRPLSFKTSQGIGTITSKSEGQVGADGKLTVTAVSGGQTTTQTLDWPQGAVLAEGARLLQLQKGLKEGTKYNVRVFEASTLKAMDAAVEVGPKVKVDLLGRVVELTEVRTTVRMPLAGSITTVSYLDDEMEAMKTVTAVLGMKLEMVTCTKEVALSEVQPVDFFDRFLLKSPVPLAGVAGARSITYELSPTSGQELAIPERPYQKVKRAADGTVVVTVTAAKAPRGATFPYEGDDKSARSAMGPTRYLESDNEAVVALARKAVGDTKDAAAAIRRIERFVRGYITTKSLSVGYASAAEVAAGREGDCTEHAVLAAAMCRAVGIPAQVASGVAYAAGLGEKKHIFGPHAWVRAYVGDQWIGLDAAMPGGFDAGHIELCSGNGEIESFFGMVNTLGCFEIKKVTVER